MSSSTTGASRKETERTKLIQEKCQTLLTQMLRDEDNKYCVDCDAKGPRWASWNLGVFLCIRCAGIHRNLGVHISRVKSVNLDTWTPEQVISLQQMGNSRARAVYEAQLPDGFRRPQTDTALESFIRAKYEHKKYLAREWVPPSPPKVDWAKEIDEELEKQKRKKKAAQACSALGLSVGEKKSTTGTPKSAPLPAPLPKPKPGQSGSSPKTHRIPSAAVSAAAIDAQPSNDLLGLSSPTKPLQNNGGIGVAMGGAAQDLHNDSFSGFLSAAPNPLSGDSLAKAEVLIGNAQNSLAKEEEDFFNQGSLGGLGGADKDKSGKLTKDSILALYGAAPSNPVAAAHNPHNPQMAFGQPQPMFPASGAFTGMAPAYMGAGGAVPHPQQQQHQFMTPPNSASMYNSPVMTAPTAFTAPGMHMAAGQFPGTAAAHYAAAAQQMVGGMPNMMGGAGGIMATGQPQVQAQAANLNLMHTNQSLLSGMTMMAQPPMMAAAQSGQMVGMGGMNMSLGAVGSMPMTMGGGFQAPGANAATANLNQQFGNLNIGNVWQ